jgi:hypothetical protein
MFCRNLFQFVRIAGSGKYRFIVLVFFYDHAQWRFIWRVSGVSASFLRKKRVLRWPYEYAII